MLARRKSGAAKLAITARLRRETTLSTKAIAARVHLGSSKAANRSLHSYMRRGAQSPARARGNWGYDQRSYKECPKLWVYARKG